MMERDERQEIIDIKGRFHGDERDLIEIKGVLADLSTRLREMEDQERLRYMGHHHEHGS